jgi:hypothetical protein
VSEFHNFLVTLLAGSIVGYRTASATDRGPRFISPATFVPTTSCLSLSSPSSQRHAKAVAAEHKTAKALSRATADHDKTAADLEKAKEDLEIKKRHTATTTEGYEKAKAHIDSLRETKAKNDKDRARRASSMHGGTPVA